MVKILKRKAKAFYMVKDKVHYIKSPKELADQINQVDADAQGITLKEYYKRQAIRTAQQTEYKKTHWVSKLTDNQKYLIVTTTTVPHTYMNLPLSKDNQKEVDAYKETSEAYQRWLMKVDSYNKSQIMSKVLRDSNPRFKGDEAFGQIMEDITWHKVRLNYKELLEQHGEKFKILYDAYKLHKGKASSDKLAVHLRTMRKETQAQKKIRMAMKSLEESMKPLKDATENIQKMIAKDYQALGRKLRLRPDIEDTDIEVKANRYKYDEKFERAEKNRLVETANGLNTLMAKNKLKKPLDIAGHYLKTHNEPNKADYFVDSFDNAVALANATGMLPQRLFKLVCDDLVKRKKHYEEQAFISDGIKIEEIINLYNDKKEKNKSYSFSMFYKCKERNTWSSKYEYDWKSYKRFMEDFPKWIRIFKAEAHKRAESDADIVADFMIKG